MNYIKLKKVIFFIILSIFPLCALSQVKKDTLNIYPVEPNSSNINSISNKEINGNDSIQYAMKMPYSIAKCDSLKYPKLNSKSYDITKKMKLGISVNYALDRAYQKLITENPKTNIEKVDPNRIDQICSCSLINLFTKDEIEYMYLFANSSVGSKVDNIHELMELFYSGNLPNIFTENEIATLRNFFTSAVWQKMIGHFEYREQNYYETLKQALIKEIPKPILEYVEN